MPENRLSWPDPERLKGARVALADFLNLVELAKTESLFGKDDPRNEVVGRQKNGTLVDSLDRLVESLDELTYGLLTLLKGSEAADFAERYDLVVPNDSPADDLEFLARMDPRTPVFRSRPSAPPASLRDRYLWGTETALAATRRLVEVWGLRVFEQPRWAIPPRSRLVHPDSFDQAKGRSVHFLPEIPPEILVALRNALGILAESEAPKTVLDKMREKPELNRKEKTLRFGGAIVRKFREGRPWRLVLMFDELVPQPFWNDG